MRYCWKLRLRAARHRPGPARLHGASAGAHGAAPFQPHEINPLPKQGTSHSWSLGLALEGLAGFCSGFCFQGLFAPASLGGHLRNDREGSALILPAQCWHRRGCCCWGSLLEAGCLLLGQLVNLWGSLLLGGGGSQELVAVLGLVTVWQGHCCLGSTYWFWGAVAAVGWFWLVFSFSPTKAPLSPSKPVGQSQA